MTLHNKQEAFASALVRESGVLSLPRKEMPHDGTGGQVAYDLLSNELLLDGSARLNLATFVTTWMPPYAARLMADTADKNMIDKDEYPQTAEFEKRCVNIIGHLWHAPGHEDVTGTSTTGSSEAAMLGGLALKWRWRERMKAAGKPVDRPNLVMGVNVQVCWDKFCRYWDVEPRLVPMEGDRFHLDRRPGRGALRREHDRRGRDPRLDVRRQLRAGEGDLRGARRSRGRRRPGRAGARGRGVGRLRRAVRAARARMGLPAAASALDQRLGTQVRARLPGRGLGDLARCREAPARPRVRRELPRRQHAHLCAQLLAPGERGDRAVLHVPQPRTRGLRDRPDGRIDRRTAHRRARSTASARTS